MSAVSEWVVSEYFELLGFLVTQPHKHVTSGKQKNQEDAVDLLVVNPAAPQNRTSSQICWTSKDVSSVARAVVAVRGWHTDRFYVSTFEQAPDLLAFTEPETTRFAEEMLGSSDIARILCLPELPASDPLKTKLLAFLKEKGVSGVLTFRTVLTELIERVDKNRNYSKSDLLQVIRLLKNYDLVKGKQMELFSTPRRRRKSKRKQDSKKD